MKFEPTTLRLEAEVLSSKPWADEEVENLSQSEARQAILVVGWTRTTQTC